MFDLKLTPVAQNLTNLSNAVAELQEFAVHKSDLAVSNLNIQTIADSVTIVSGVVVDHGQRLENLEEQMRKMKFGNDDSFKRLVFLGLPNMSFEERLSAMQSFMSSNFPKITLCDCSVFFTLNKTNKKWEETSVGYIQVASRSVRDRIFQEIEDKALKLVMQGKQIAIKKARSKSATDRDRALRKAAEELKKTHLEKDIEIVWRDSRGVKVSGEWAYKQGRGEDGGCFVGAFEHLEVNDL